MKKEDIKKLFNIDTKEKYDLEKRNAIALFVIFVLVIVATIHDIVTIIAPHTANGLVSAIFSLIITIFVIYYGAYGYKAPYGNIMRYLYLTYAFANAFILAFVENDSKASIICNLIAIIAAAYMSGRLNKYRENTYIILVGFVALFIRVVLSIATGDFVIGRIIGMSNSFILWCALGASYLARFQYHRIAGLEDKIQ